MEKMAILTVKIGGIHLNMFNLENSHSSSMLVFSPPRYTVPFNSSINVLFYAKSTSCVKNCLVPCDHICCCCHVLRCDCSARRGNGLLATGSGPALISTLCRILGIFFFLKSWNIHWHMYVGFLGPRIQGDLIILKKKRKRKKIL